MAIIRVTVRRPGQSTQAPIRIVKSAAEGRVKRSAKRPSRRSQATTGGWSCQACEQAEDAGDIVSKSASPWGWCEQPSQRGRVLFSYSSPPTATASIHSPGLGRGASAPPAAGLDWLYLSVTSNGRRTHFESAKVHLESLWWKWAQADYEKVADGAILARQVMKMSPNSLKPLVAIIKELVADVK